MFVILFLSSYNALLLFSSIFPLLSMTDAYDHRFLHRSMPALRFTRPQSPIEAFSTLSVQRVLRATAFDV